MIEKGRNTHCNLEKRTLNRKALRPALVAFFASFIVLSILSWLIYANLKKEQAAHQASELENAKYKVANYLKENFQLADMMAGYISANPGISSEEFDQYAGKLMRDFNRNVLSIQFVDSNIIKYVHPTNQSEQVIGLDISKYKTTRNLVNRSIRDKKPHINGPIPLYQGGDGVVYRMPIYFEDSLKGQRFIGFTAVVIKLESLFDAIHLEDNKDFEYALRLQHNAFENEFYNKGVFYGNNNFFNDEAKTAAVPGTNGKWVLGIRLRENIMVVMLLIVLLIGSGLLSFLVAMITYANRQRVNFIKDQKQLLELKNQEIEKQIGEKIILMNEVHHRVKNNFQLISSLARLQSYEIEDPKAVEALQEFSSRVSSLALTHEHLSNKENISKASIKSYIESLCDNLIRDHHEKIHTQYDIDDTELPIKKVISLGIIINELITNSLKYAFDKAKDAKISIRLKPVNSHFKLEYLDNGNQLPEDLLKQEKTSLGIDLVQSITHQIDGKIEQTKTQRGNGFIIEF